MLQLFILTIKDLRFIESIEFLSESLQKNEIPSSVYVFPIPA